ncbi:MAG: HAD family hydrolase [Candidatus Glassbacteria bacterium]
MNPDKQTIRAAFIDVDGTLIEGTTCERQLLRYLLAKGKLKFSSIMLSAVRLLPDVLRSRFSSIRSYKRYWRGISEKELRLLLPDFFEQRIHSRLRPTLLSELSTLREKGYTLVLLSGTPLPILEELGKRLGIDILIGTELEVNSGFYTGKVIGIHPYGERKLQALQRAGFYDRLDLSNSTAYCDSWHDRFLLEVVGKPVTVCPDSRLSRLAVGRGWRIIT